jgi:hypothetical protein
MHGSRGGKWSVRDASDLCRIGHWSISELVFFSRSEICTPHNISRVVCRFRNEQLLLRQAMGRRPELSRIVAPLEINVVVLDARVFIFRPT